MAQRTYKFWLAQAPYEAQIRALNDLPGIRWVQSQPRMILAPENLAWLVERALAKLQMSARMIDPPKPLAPFDPAGIAQIPHLREWVDAFLRPFQREGIAFAMNRPGTLLYHPAGAGKTLESIIWGLGKPGQIVVTTRAPVRRQWAREVEKYTTANVQLIEGTKPVTVDPEAHFIITSHEILPWHKDAIIKARPTSFILDELHRLKNRRRVTVIPVKPGEEQPDDVIGRDGDRIRFDDIDNAANAASKIAKVVKRRMGTSATPVKDRLRDLWAQLDLLEPYAWGNYRSWVTRYCAAIISPWGGLDDKSKSLLYMPELRGRLSFCVHYVSHATTHAHLPPKRRIVSKVPAEMLLKTSSVSKKELDAAQKGGELSFIEAKLADACSRKQPAILELVEEAIGGIGKVVVFTGRRKDCDRLAVTIRKLAPEACPVWSGHGGHSQSERDNMVQAFMASSGPAVFIGTTDAFGEGLNLNDADVAIISMLPLTPGAIAQAEGRFSRLGQKRPVLIYYLIAEGTIDERYASLVLDKLPAVVAIAGDEEMMALKNTLGGKDREEEFIKSVLAKLAETAVTAEF